MERNDVIKTLECCTSTDKTADCPIGCPFGDINSCEESLMYHALDLIRELTEENAIKSQKRANIFEIADAYQRGRADTIRKMRDRLSDKAKLRYVSADVTVLAVDLDDIDRIVQELLGGEQR